jgi:hypothetical protein
MSDANETVALVEADVANESHEDVAGESQDDTSSENVVDDVVACERGLPSDV